MKGTRKSIRDASIIAALREGLSVAKVSTLHKIGQTQIRRIAADHGFEFPKAAARGPIPATAFAILAQLFDLSNSYTKIGKLCNVTSQRIAAIYRAAKEANIPGLPKRDNE